MKKLLFLTVVWVGLVLAGCSSSGSAVVANTGSGGENTAVNRLTENYADALPVQAQLAIGLMQLEDTASAVDETQAADMLPLWRAVQSLSNSDTTAEVEITAVLNQIQDALSPEQIQAIAAMKLTQDSLQSLIADGVLTFGRGGSGGVSANADGAASGGLAGGPPSGGLMGGPGGGAGGGMGGGLGGDPGAMQTRQAEFAAEGGSADFQTVAMTNAVIRLLENKTGEAPAGNFGAFGSAITAVSQATGLSEDDVRAAMNEGQTLAQILEANGGNVTAVTAELAASLADSPMLQGQDPQEFVTNLLNGGQPLTNQPPQE